MSDWLEFIAAFMVFFASHSIPVRPHLKIGLQQHLGKCGFTLFYGMISFIMLGWLIHAAGSAPYVELWSWAEWQSWTSICLMFVVCILVALTIGRANPLSIGGYKNNSFDPARPGLIRYLRHPLLVALALWALAHTFPNGNLAHFIMFGSFAVFAWFGQYLVDNRKREQMGETWVELVLKVRDASHVASQIGLSSLLRLAAGVVIFACLIVLHSPLIGVDPIP